MFTPICFDGSGNGDNIESFHAMADAGIKLVFLKASQGASFKDFQYRSRADRAASVPGLFVGGYHFLNYEDPELQLANFLSCIKAGEIMALDCEKYDAHPDQTVTVEIAEAVVSGLLAASGRLPVLYCGSWLFEQESRGKINPVSILRKCPGWGYRYSDQLPQMIHGMDLVLHQFTGDGVGPLPHTISGCSNNADLSRWIGNVADIPAWAAKHSR